MTGAKRKGAQRVQKPKIEIYQEAQRWLGSERGGFSRPGYRWRLVGKNGKILADSGESYTRKHGAKRALDTLFSAIEALRFSDIIDLTLSKEH